MRKKKKNSVNMIDVAAAAGVSQSTVSRVIQGNPAISRDTRETVIEAARRLGYRFPVSAENLKNTDIRQQVVDLYMCPLPEQDNVDPLFTFSFFSMILKGVQDILSAAGMVLRTSTVRSGYEGKFSEVGGNPKILLNAPSYAFRNMLQERRIPYVIVTGDPQNICNENLVSVDNFGMGFAGGNYLLERGIRRVGFMLPKVQEIRYYGFLCALNRSGVNVLPQDLKLLPNGDLETYIHVLHDLIKSNDLPEALVVGADSGVAEAIEPLLRIHGISVPDQMFLLSFAHESRSRTYPCFLLDPTEMGRRAAMRIQDLIKHPDDKPYKITIPCQLDE